MVEDLLGPFDFPSRGAGAPLPQRREGSLGEHSSPNEKEMPPTPRAIPPVVHGSVSAAELAAYGLSLVDVVDFSVSTNPLGPAPSVLRRVAETDWSRYPGDDEQPLRVAIAAQHGVEPGMVVLGNGSAEILWLLALAFLRRGDRVGIVGPTFGEYARAARVVGAMPAESASLDACQDAAMGIVCNPNNPTGRLLSSEQITDVGCQAAARLLVIDEAYMDFAPDALRWGAAALLPRLPNLVVLRSFTKEQAIPGLRLGYALANVDVARALEGVRPPWSVNAGALRAGLAALQPEAREHVQRARQEVSQARAFLTRELTSLGLAVHPSATNFLLVDVGDGGAFRQALLPRGFVVRSCVSFGLPSCVRIACRRVEECRALVQAIHTVRAEARGW